MERQAVLHRHLLPGLYPPSCCERADQTEPRVVYPGPGTVGVEAVVCLVSQSGAVVAGGLGRSGDVDITGSAQPDSDNQQVSLIIMLTADC